MKHFVFIAVLILSTSITCTSQPIKCIGDETPEQFVVKNHPDGAELDTDKGGPVIKCKWDSVPVIIAFYGQNYKLPLENDADQMTYLRLLGYIFIQKSVDTYEKIFIDTIDEEGDAPQIESVFFARADKNSFKSLILIVSWKQQHYDVSGTLYGTFIYHKKLVNGHLNLSYDKVLSEKLSGGCECDRRDEPSEKAKYKTAKDIRVALKKLGY